MTGIKLVATGRGTPGRRVTNDDLAQRVATSDAWIRERTGIASRYFCTEEENGVSLATAAAQEALARSQVSPEAIGACIVATVSPDSMTPSTANLVAANLGLPLDIPSFDIGAACSGFLYALRVAQGLLTDPARPYALIVGCEVLSRLMDFSDRSTCVLFGDGAGAAVVKRDDQAIFYSLLGAEADSGAIHVDGPAAPRSVIRMDGRKVFRFAVQAIPRVIDGLLAQSGMALSDFDEVVCHQANARIIDHVVKKLKADPDRFYKNMDRYGNTSAASIPMALDELCALGRLKPGARVMCVGFGAGLTWGGAILEIGAV
jgi:3-oxoacyl-[acyl-carrier-protein] synthase-3